MAPRPGNEPPRGRLEVIAARIVTPADAYGPARAYCTAEAGGYRVVFGLDGGRRDEPVGPVFPTPREAIALSRLLNRRLETTA